MFEVPDGAWKGVEAAAKSMLAANETIAPLPTPDGDAMLYLTTDPAKLRLTLMRVDVEGSTIHVGIPAGK